MQALRFVSAAIRHAESLADEAQDLGLHPLSSRLRCLGSVIARELEAAVAALDELEPAREARALAHHALSAVYGESTLRLEAILEREEASLLSPGGHLDVVERMRFRLRRLEARRDASPALDEVRTDLERALFSYDTTVDAYLLACADAQAKKDRVVAGSQALRLELERAKLRLLARAEAGSDAWKRIKRRPVRTKRARWLDTRAVERLLEEARAA